jgi:hypothetical protein
MNIIYNEEHCCGANFETFGFGIIRVELRRKTRLGKFFAWRKKYKMNLVL